MWRRQLLMGAASTSIVLNLVLLLFLCVSSCRAHKNHPQNQYCYDYLSSCGNIPNISYPFRLKGDPYNCTDPTLELECHNNRTVLNLDSKGYYYVEAITYENFSIRVVDPGLHKDHNNCSVLPLHSLSFYDRHYSYPFDSYTWEYQNKAVIFLDCVDPANSTRYIQFDASCSNTNSSFQKHHYSYVVFGGPSPLRMSEVEDSCSISKVTWASSHGPSLIHNKSSATFSEIHEDLVYGFELLWYGVYCGSICQVDCDLIDNVVRCPDACHPLRSTSQCLRLIFMDVIWFCQLTSEFLVLFLVARFFCGIPCLLTLLVYKMRRRHLSMFDTIEDFLQSHNNLMPIRYSYSEIKKITNGFKHKLGEGGYGTVYKGKLRSGLFVAVKMMGKSKATGQEFINEVATIGRIHHVNVVRLVGFCSHGSKRALVYDFMPNGSLEKYIFSREEETISLSCEKMFEIALKVAGGIEYLHRGCDMQILHFDIKPHNILLDENFIPKISDFGLAKLYATDDSIVTLTAARGTMGYMAPELFYKNIGGVSYKADVYSFGMLLMEMAGKRKNLNAFADHSSQIYFPSWVYDQFSEGKEIELGDASEEEREMVKKMVIVALWCIQLKPSDRPSMNKVVEMLEGNVELLHMPPKPFLCPQETPTRDNGTNTTPRELPRVLSSDSITLDIPSN